MTYQKKALNHKNITLENRIYRLVWRIICIFLFRFTPIFMHKWRIFLLNLFGANISNKCYIYPDVRIWSPENLKMSSGSTLGPNVNCYNCDLVVLGINTTVSQDVTLCTGTHDVSKQSFSDDPEMPLLVAPIVLKDFCWITAEVFIHPGVTVDEGSIVSARSVVNHSLNSWGIYAGFPAKRIGDRKLHPNKET